MKKIIISMLILSASICNAQGWKNIRIIGTTLGANKFLKSDMNGLISGSLLSISDIPVNIPSTIWNQSGAIQTADYRISGVGYSGRIVLGAPYTLMTNNRLYIASNSPSDPSQMIITFKNGNEAGLDTTPTIALIRVAQDSISISDTSNQFGFVRANSLLGQITGSGASRDEGISAGHISTGNPFVKLGFYAENDWLNRNIASTRFIVSTKAIGSTSPIERLRITGSGNVGISTSAPMAALHVNGTNPLALTGLQGGGSSDSALSIFNNIVRKVPFSTITAGLWSTSGNANTSSANSFIGTTDNISLRFRTNNIQRMVIDSAFGNVAIGGAVTNRKFNVSDSNTVAYTSTGVSALPPGLFSGINNISNTNGTLVGISINPINSVGVGQIAYLGAVSNPSGNSPEIVIGSRTGTSTYAERLRITAAGNIGIGTSIPLSSLQISGSFALTDTATVSAITAGAQTIIRITNSTHTVTLPTASTCRGRVYEILNETASSTTITSVIDFATGSGSTSIPTKTYWRIYSDGTNWRLLSRSN